MSPQLCNTHKTIQSFCLYHFFDLTIFSANTFVGMRYNQKRNSFSKKNTKQRKNMKQNIILDGLREVKLDIELTC